MTESGTDSSRRDGHPCTANRSCQSLPQLDAIGKTVLVATTGRSYPRAYRVSGRRDLRDFLASSIEACNARVMHASEPSSAPFYFGIELGEERLGVLAYAFRCNPPPIKGRPPDEHRVQVRYGSEPSWKDAHPLGQDPASVDVTLVLGVNPDIGFLIGLDPLSHDPLPMGISVEFKQGHVDAIRDSGWQVWERDNRSGTRRQTPRSRDSLETMIGFSPARLLDYARLERQATALGLDPALRFKAAIAASTVDTATKGARHLLETEFDLDHQVLLDIITQRSRLKVAVRGGVAEHHLEQHLRRDRAVVEVEQVDQDGPPDFIAKLADGRTLRVECKNASPKTYTRAAGLDERPGDPKVEVQKTRAQKGDPAGRLYRPQQFDILAACLVAATGKWEFRFRASKSLERDGTFPDRIRAMQRVTGTWTRRLADVK